MLRNEAPAGIIAADKILFSAYQELAQTRFQYITSYIWPNKEVHEASLIVLNAIAHLWEMPRIEREMYVRYGKLHPASRD